jgi:uncharacterized protein involved in cysteine biosynthesis
MGHKLTNYLRFSEMQNMLKDKRSQSTKFQPIIKVKTIINSVNMVDVMLPFVIRQMKNECLKTENQGRTN